MLNVLPDSLFKSNTSDFLVLRLMNLLPPDLSVEFWFHSWEEAACNHILCFSNSAELQKFLPQGSRKKLQVGGELKSAALPSLFNL